METNMQRSISFLLLFGFGFFHKRRRVNSQTEKASPTDFEHLLDVEKPIKTFPHTPEAGSLPEQ